MSDRVTQYDVPDGANDIVIFVHGFGVRYDSRGMFETIAQRLPKNWGFVLFDFYDIHGHDVHITSVSDQIKRLGKIHADIISRYPETRIHIIAHSKGCIIASLSKIKVGGMVIFLAPPRNIWYKN